MGLARGITDAQYSKVSATRRSEGSTGKTQAPRAKNSFRMSFWTIGRSCAAGTPCFSPVTWYRARKRKAGALIVNEQLMRSSGMPSKSTSKSASESIATPTRPTSARHSGWSES